MSDLLVKLQIYEGPLDLLLHLIKKNEVNLDDIPVALITAQYLEYLDLMESLNVELAADFLVMAATLTQIKSRLLLPREDDEEQDNDPAEDLKAALIDPLLERLRQGLGDYRDAAELLRRRQFLGSDVFVRGRQILDDERGSALADGQAEVSLFDLVAAFRRLAERKSETKTLKFVVESKTLGQRLTEMRSFLIEKKRGAFSEICAGDKSPGELALSFLGLLELARVGFLRLYQKAAAADIEIFLADPEAEVSGLENLDY